MIVFIVRVAPPPRSGNTHDAYTVARRAVAGARLSAQLTCCGVRFIFSRLPLDLDSRYIRRFRDPSKNEYFTPRPQYPPPRLPRRVSFPVRIPGRERRISFKIHFYYTGIATTGRAQHYLRNTRPLEYVPRVLQQLLSFNRRVSHAHTHTPNNRIKRTT